jgi:hypothetical protein
VGYKSGRGTLIPPAEETTELTVKLEEISTAPPTVSSSGGKPWKLVAGGATAGVGVGLLVAGLVSDSTANKRSEQILDASADGDVERLDRLEKAADSARTRSVILTASGGTLAALGGVLLFLHFTDDSGEQRVTVAPSVGPDGVNVAAEYRW